MAKKRKYIDRVENVKGLNPEAPTYFVVLRNDRRVSDTNHFNKTDAMAEENYWRGLLSKWNDSSKTSIVECKNPGYVKSDSN